jgi:hypothetical protein
MVWLVHKVYFRREPQRRGRVEMNDVTGRFCNILEGNHDPLARSLLSLFILNLPQKLLQSPSNHTNIYTFKMANRPVVLGGLAIAGAAGYYLYSAGGDPKVAEKKFERKRILNFNRFGS